MSKASFSEGGEGVINLWNEERGTGTRNEEPERGTRNRNEERGTGTGTRNQNEEPERGTGTRNEERDFRTWYEKPYDLVQIA